MGLFIDFHLEHCRRWLFASLIFGSFLCPSLSAATLPSPVEPNVIRPGSIYFRFQVSWELMRSGFNTMDVALEAETYTEYWAILYVGPDEIDLLTPRGRTRVTGLRHGDEADGTFPNLLIVNEAEFTRLLGMDPDPSGALDKWVFIDLPTRDSNEQNFTLKASPKYFVSVQLTINY